MKNWKEIVQQDIFRYIDHTDKQTFHGEAYTATTSFAVDDALATSVSNGESPPSVRLWVHPKTVVLGIPDVRVPDLDKGVKLLADKLPSCCPQFRWACSGPG
ncbi:hypothetical protein P5G51_003070 [Virgibacillus sp. 179-BFC.A HS]|uniref:Uncharacterized protein n=1 Tax=Tigheibacillus jepli TaxID=3035914 RepID=A0ABU5CDV8_9BACI|nr:hypothetical protein [Virgibacillus sp. 179-BFC.A HS]MDY0404523.1 hypothetical protein [Virgibacillus sp. 179-BFC.A HS]